MPNEYIGRIEALNACYNGWNMDTATIEAITVNIGRIPAADVAPVRHASWIEDGYNDEPCVCSNCGEPGKPEWRFCTNCGAECKGGQSDD